MIYLNIEVLKYSFIILAIIAVLLILFTFTYKPISKTIIRNNYRELYGKKIYKIAEYNDYYLINNFVYKFADGTNFYIDHILFGDKYIYVIKDIYYDGGLSAKANDNDWILYSKQRKQAKKSLIRNPLKDNLARLTKLAKVTGIDESLFISVVTINNDCQISEYDPIGDNSYLSKPRYISRLVKEIEERDIKPINARELANAVQDIANLNKKDER